MKMLVHSLCAAALLTLGAAANAQIIVLDQITEGTLGSTPGFGVNQIFGDFPEFSGAVIDDFSLDQGLQLHTAAVVGEITNTYAPSGFQVSIWDSVANAASSGNSLSGNTVAQQFVPIGDVTTIPLADAVYAAIVPINLTLPAGDYFLGLIPVQDFVPNGQHFIISSSAGTPGGNNSVGINPGNGFGLGTSIGVNTNAALYLEGQALVPEPGSVALFAGVMVIGGLAARRRARK
jgi:hypothetical protein